MGQQQLILLVLGSIIVAIAVAVGITQFRLFHTESVGDQIQEILLNQVVQAKTHLEKPKTLGGGGGTFEGFKLPKDLRSVDGITFTMGAVIGSASTIVMTGVAPAGSITVIVSQQDTGLVLQWIGMGAYTSRTAAPKPF